MEIRNDYGGTALYIAARFGAIEIVKVLLEADADVNAKQFTYGYTPLMIALLNGHTAVVQELLDNGADVQATSADGSSALHHAVIGGQIDLVKVRHQLPQAHTLRNLLPKM